VLTKDISALLDGVKSFRKLKDLPEKIKKLENRILVLEKQQVVKCPKCMKFAFIIVEAREIGFKGSAIYERVQRCSCCGCEECHEIKD